MLYHLFLTPFSLLFVVSLAQEANVTITPTSLNIALNQTAEINCTAKGSHINWKINGTPLADSTVFDTNSKPAVQMEGLTFQSMIVLGSSVSNGTNVTCSSSSKYFAKSHPVLVLVQGLLESVSNLTVTPINSTTVLFSWSPPFTLEGVPILGYNVTITNTINEENEIISVEWNTTMLYYSIDHPDPGNNFTVTVVSINVIGAGEPFTSDPFTMCDEITPRTMSSDVVRETPVTDIPTAKVTDVPVNIILLAAVVPTTAATFLISVIILVTVCALVLWKKKRNAASRDALYISNNPAYEQVKVKKIDVQDNSAYCTVNHVAVQDTCHYEDPGTFAIRTDPAVVVYDVPKPVVVYDEPKHVV